MQRIDAAQGFPIQTIRSIENNLHRLEPTL